ncbi:phenylalanyl-tRNA synthetase subunit beta [Corynebacterium atypicum]|uniref:Phenylalanine--tRNA ligase beta subunit n=1 Tax=Corynebacterium atypicum TaxID=191610 RepID=A0ABM5QN14_9CORY|nr:phenylalanine--tRNA ligase subunit beta [Corynebacterium atypicum]AIG64201.1 phenylalanyl-tRNA synthetase subunit beta [Corynebacterium atypicum]
MFISQQWLTDILSQANPGWRVTPEELDAGFVRVGFETEGYRPIPATTGPLVIGRVVEIEELSGFKKPIRYCQVDVGKANGTGELQGIICGARNFAEGDHVAVALPGAVLPGGFEISARKTYSHISAGMICSAAELGLTDAQNAGIINLGADAAAFGADTGDDARPVLGLDDTIFEVNITPDRGYALSARGLARELASAFNLRYEDLARHAIPHGWDVPEASEELIGVDLRPETQATRFGLRKVTGISPEAPTPYWLERVLMTCGARSVNLPTDVTNFVMFLLGQPMHAFDADVIAGDLTVRKAARGEKLTTLDHIERELTTDDVVICDAAGIQSLAGVMGGTTSEISDTTTNVYFEAATWDNLTVARTSRRHKLASESSRRFERGVDPALVEPALDLAAALLAELGGGTVEPSRTIVGKIPAMPTIIMDPQLPSRIAGVDYSTETVTNRLTEVGCTVTRGDQLQVTPPTWRGDLTMGEDLVEEILRLEGLEDIPTILPTPRGGRGLSPRQKLRRRIGHALAYSGYAEVIADPFMRNDQCDAWGLAGDDPRRRTVTVRNPLDNDYGVIATTLLPALLDAVARNIARGRRDLQLFGVQQVAFSRGENTPMPDVNHRPTDDAIREVLDSLPDQPLHAAAVGVGETELTGPWGNGRAFDWADAIETARLVARTAGVHLDVINATELPWHPGRCAALKVGDATVGFAGELYPQLLEAAGLPPRVCAMEIDLDALPVDAELPAPVLSSFPLLHQDIALVVSEDVPAEDVRKVIVEGAGELLEDATLFDIYRGENLGAGLKSLAFKLHFRAEDRTLTDDEANEARMNAAALASERLGATLRA